MSPRRKKHHEEENAERWLLTYADMITLLVAFFMMMYSMSVLNLEKFKAAAIGIRSGFNSPSLGEHQTGGSMIERGFNSRPDNKMPIQIMPASRPQGAQTGDRARPKGRAAKSGQAGGRLTPAQLQTRRVGKLTDKLNKSLVGVSLGEAAKVVAERRGVAIELVGELIFFPAGSAELSQDAKNILLAVRGVLSTLENEVSVEGHSSRLEAEQSQAFRSSWEMSTARAMAVVNYLTEKKKVNPRRVSITGFGHYRPIAQGDKTTQVVSSRTNDRVRIFIYQE